MHWNVTSVVPTVAKAYTTTYPPLMYFPYEEGGALIDDDVITLDLVFEANCDAARYCGAVVDGYVTGARDWMEQNKTPKRKVWAKACGKAIFAYVPHDVPGEHRVYVSKRINDDTGLVARLEGAYGQTMYSALQSGNMEEDKVYYNLIKGVEIGYIDLKKLTSILKSVGDDRLSKIKKALGVSRLSVKTLYNDLTVK